MSKKKSLENIGVRPTSSDQNADHGSETSTEGGANHPPVESLGELAHEVQSFLDRRHELAKKLNLEIEATEKKLVELKKTVEMLFANNDGDGQAEKERTNRKTKKVTKNPKTTDGSGEKQATEGAEQAASGKKDEQADKLNSEN